MVSVWYWVESQRMKMCLQTSFKTDWDTILLPTYENPLPTKMTYNNTHKGPLLLTCPCIRGARWHRTSPPEGKTVWWPPPSLTHTFSHTEVQEWGSGVYQWCPSKHSHVDYVLTNSEDAAISGHVLTYSEAGEEFEWPLGLLHCCTDIAQHQTFTLSYHPCPPTWWCYLISTCTLRRWPAPRPAPCSNRTHECCPKPFIGSGSGECCGWTVQARGVSHGRERWSVLGLPLSVFGIKNAMMNVIYCMKIKSETRNKQFCITVCKSKFLFCAWLKVWKCSQDY